MPRTVTSTSWARLRGRDSRKRGGRSPLELFGLRASKRGYSVSWTRAITEVVLNFVCASYVSHPSKDHIEAELVAWTSRACAVRWRTRTGEEHRAWVWASAVGRLD
jgi:hypothetical protein